MNRQFSDDDVMRALAGVNPLPPRPARAATETVRREALLERITATPPTGEPAFPRRRLGARIAALLATIAIALAAAFGAATPATAGGVLREAAAAAAAATLGDGQYWHIRAEVQYPDQPPHPYELWHSDTRQLLRSGHAAAVDAAGRGTDHLDPHLIRVKEMTDAIEGGLPPRFGGGLRLTADELALLPTDPDELRRRILQRIDWRPYGDDYTVWDTIVGLLWTDPLSPAQRKAAWEVLADVGAARLLGDATDAAGRRGQAIEVSWDHRLGREIIVVDPGQGALLEVRDYAPGSDDPIHRSTILEWGTVDTAPDPEPPLCGPGSVPYTSC